MLAFDKVIKICRKQLCLRAFIYNINKIYAKQLLLFKTYDK